jgi:RimJ/RimL family protein N-acetyltransferase
VPSPYSLADAEAFIGDALHRLLVGERARLAIAAEGSGELLGSISLDVFAERQAAEIGYWVKREARRRGVALAAARLVVRWAFRELGVERLEILTYPGNAASQALAEKLGFRRECLLRGFLATEPGKSREGRVVPSEDGNLPARDDQVQFVLLREEWEGRRQG